MSGVLLNNTHPALRRCWHPVARANEVGDAPVRSVLLGEPLVLFRSGGRAVAFLDRCPHRRAPLSLGQCEGDTLRCAYHGWRFGGDGDCVEIPALGPEAIIPGRARLVPVADVAERGGMIFAALEPPIAPLGFIEESEDPSFAAGELPTMRARASIGLLADNFLDMAHFPFVHKGTFGADEAAEVERYEVVREGWSFTARREHRFVNREDPGVEIGIRPLVQSRRLTYRLDAPFHLQLRIDFVEAGGTNVIGFFLQPHSDEACSIYTTLWRNDLGGDAEAMAAAVKFEVEVLAEDLIVQEAYDDLVLPLDPAAELHTRADRSTLELRRLLSDLVAATRAPAPDRARP
jgi:phenylpropionate dioxygenase-like ring-hydroxylating dioxygenase large terminal subunit